jgi:hypothetical protein
VEPLIQIVFYRLEDLGEIKWKSLVIDDDSVASMSATVLL